MRGKHVLGIIFANADDSVLGEITGIRSMASVPFGGGYRIIDFILSNMVNAGMNKVGIITGNNYQSLMDHVGGGKPWDLTGRDAGIHLLPPFNAAALENYNMSRLGALRNVMHFLERSTEEFVLMTDCTYVSNIDLSDVFEKHQENNADITILYKHGTAPQLQNRLSLEITKSGKVTSAALGTSADGEGDYAVKCLVMRKSMLERLINESFAKSENSFEKVFILDNINKLNICAYEVKGFCPIMDSLKSYFDANFALLDKDIYKELFFERPVYSKVYDDMPAVYGLKSDVSNSLIADGSVINGKVENSIIFRDCRVEKGATVKNCIILPHGIISENASVAYAVTDKSVTVRSGRNISGADTFPVYIGKGIRV